MKRMILFAVLIALCAALCNAQAENGTSGTLVVYFDYSENMGDLTGMSVDAITSASLNAATENTRGNLQVMAETIQEITGADVFPIHVQETHDPVYLNMVMPAGEDQENNRAFTILDLPESFDGYETIYFGTPVWHAQLPQPVASFLQQVDWSGKHVIVFGIHLGSGWGRNLTQIRELQPDAEIVEGITVFASESNDEAREAVSAFLNAE
jgi:flavodoxin